MLPIIREICKVRFVIFPQFFNEIFYSCYGRARSSDFFHNGEKNCRYLCGIAMKFAIPVVTNLLSDKE